MLLLAGDNLPQISQIYTDGLSAKDPPTDFTDLHRWLGCVDSSGGILASAAAKCLPQISQIYTDGLSAKDPPTDYTEFTEPSAGDNLPQISQMQFQGVHPNHLCKSVKSVGEYTQ